VGPVVAERPEVQRVDPRGQADPDGVRGDPEGPAEGFVLVLDVAQDQDPVPVEHLAQAEHLHRRGLAPPRRPKEDHVGVGDAGGPGQGPADRVGVERAPGQPVDPHQRPRRRQRIRRDQRPDPADLFGRHPIHRQRRRDRRPPRPRAASSPQPHQLGERLPVPGCRGGGTAGGQVVTEVRRQPDHRPAAAVPAPHAAAAWAGGHRIPRWRGRPTPSGMQATANPESWARSRRSGANPLPRIAASNRRP